MSDTMKFSAQLAHLDGGGVDANATEKLAELVRDVRDTGRAGKLTVTIALKPHRQSHGDVMHVTATVKTSRPEFDPATTLFFSTADGDLLRDDPRQGKLPGLHTATTENRDAAGH